MVASVALALCVEIIGVAIFLGGTSGQPRRCGNVAAQVPTIRVRNELPRVEVVWASLQVFHRDAINQDAGKPIRCNSSNFLELFACWRVILVVVRYQLQVHNPIVGHFSCPSFKNSAPLLGQNSACRVCGRVEV